VAADDYRPRGSLSRRTPLLGPGACLLEWDFEADLDRIARLSFLVMVCGSRNIRLEDDADHEISFSGGSRTPLLTPMLGGLISGRH
jgi:hypothetical protein